MKDKLKFDENNYEIRTCELGGKSITFRAFEGIDYCENPVDRIQKLNIYVPESYYEGGSINGYTLKSAPIFMPNTVGGYMQGPAMEPGIDGFNGNPNTAFEALCHGYVAACAGIRGRNTGEVSKEFFVGGKAEDDLPSDGNAEDDLLPGGKADDLSPSGKLVGRAPAFVVDMKAAIRYLRHNKETVPGDTEHIITNGTSAGGALSALTGASGNVAGYEPYLESIGAAKEKDDIFAASCYCPIHNLENADAAYEWLFCGYNDYMKMRFEKENGQVRPVPVSGTMDDQQIALSKELAPMFPPYLNSLGLRDEEGNTLTLDENGNGSFKEYVKKQLLRSAQRELETHDSGRRLQKLAVWGSDIDTQDYLTIKNGVATDLDWDAFVAKIGRMKTTPAFDAIDLDSPECEEFGDEEVYARHFTDFSAAHDPSGIEKVSEEMIRLMNPTLQIGMGDTAPHWRVRHGAFDRDTSLAIPVILSTFLQNNGYDVDFALPWGLPHSGDYDLEELFAWIDGICR